MKLTTDWTSLELAAKSLSTVDAGILFRKIAAYINGSDEADIGDSAAASAIFGLVRNGIDKALRLSAIRKASGAKGGQNGGAPIGNQNAAKTKQKQSKIKQNTASETKQNKAKQSKTKQTQNAEKQIVTTENTTEIVSEVPNIYNISNNIDIDDIDNTTDTEDIEVVGTTAVSEKIDVAKFADFFNGTMTAANAVIPKITKIEGKRKTALLARLREHGRQSLGTVVKNAAVSDFLNGKNNRAWVANFDWIFKPSNFVKVLDGNYANHAPQASSQGTTATPRYPVSKEGITLNSLMQVLSKNGQSTDNDNTDSNGADTICPTY